MELIACFCYNRVLLILPLYKVIRVTVMHFVDADFVDL